MRSEPVGPAGCDRRRCKAGPSVAAGSAGRSITIREFLGRSKHDLERRLCGLPRGIGRGQLAAQVGQPVVVSEELRFEADARQLLHDGVAFDAREHTAHDDDGLLVTVIDEANDRQVFRGAIGLPEPWATLRATPLSHSFCRIVAASNAPLIVSDARRDDRVATNLAITELGVVAYLGVPIRNRDGHAVGAICMIDSNPRTWERSDVDYLIALAEAVDGQIRLELALHENALARGRAEATAAALEEANRRFANFAKTFPGAILRYREQPDGVTQVEYLSPGCEETWELSPSSVTDANAMWEQVHREDVADLKASIRRSSERLVRWQHRWRIRTPSGRVKWLDGYGEPTRAPDGSTEWSALVLDATIEVKAQHLAESTRTLLEASKQEAIGRLAGGFAHDFNNLLSILLASAERILEPSCGALETQELATEIRDTAIHGGWLTQRVLSFAGRSDLRLRVVDVNRVLSSMQPLVRRSLPMNVELETSLMAGLWTVHTDESFLESALLNLVVNARDAMPKGGRLTIETANVRVDEEFAEKSGGDLVPGRYVTISVADTGAGIRESDLPRVFEPFFTTKSAGRGTGLGLAMVQGFTKQTGGAVHVESQVDRGTCFRIYLPVAEGKAPAVRPAPTPSIGWRRDARVLLVEDQDDVRRSLRRMLESVGCSVVEAQNGDAALEIWRSGEHALDVVVTDVVMTGQLQGPELVAAIRAEGASIPAVYVSGYPREVDVQGESIDAGDIRLLKPVDHETLRLAVGRALHRTR